jgi:hypothetical protein
VGYLLSEHERATRMFGYARVMAECAIHYRKTQEMTGFRRDGAPLEESAPRQGSRGLAAA